MAHLTLKNQLKTKSWTFLCKLLKSIMMLYVLWDFCTSPGGRRREMIIFTVLRAASRNGKTISTFGLVSPWSLSSLGEDEEHAVSSKNCFSLVASSGQLTGHCCPL